jgi:hypothetical protein
LPHRRGRREQFSITDTWNVDAFRRRRFAEQPGWFNVLKLLLFVTDVAAKQARCFVQGSILFVNVRIKLVLFPGKPFRPSLIFVSKAEAYLYEAHFRRST